MSKAAIPDAVRGLGVFRSKRGLGGYVAQLTRRRSVAVHKGRHSKCGPGWRLALKKNGREETFVISIRAMDALLKMVAQIKRDEVLLALGWVASEKPTLRTMWKVVRAASGIETEGHDGETRHGAEHESPTGEAGDAQPSGPILPNKERPR